MGRWSCPTRGTRQRQGLRALGLRGAEHVQRGRRRRRPAGRRRPLQGRDAGEGAPDRRRCRGAVSADVEAGHRDWVDAVGRWGRGRDRGRRASDDLEGRRGGPGAGAGPARRAVRPGSSCRRAAQDAGVEALRRRPDRRPPLGLAGEELLRTAIDRLARVARRWRRCALVPRLVEADQIRRIVQAVPAPLRTSPPCRHARRPKSEAVGARRLSVGSGAGPLRPWLSPGESPTSSTWRGCRSVMGKSTTGISRRRTALQGGSDGPGHRNFRTRCRDHRGRGSPSGRGAPRCVASPVGTIDLIGMGNGRAIRRALAGAGAVTERIGLGDHGAAGRCGLNATELAMPGWTPSWTGVPPSGSGSAGARMTIPTSGIEMSSSGGETSTACSTGSPRSGPADSASPPPSPAGRHARRRLGRRLRARRRRTPTAWIAGRLGPDASAAAAEKVRSEWSKAGARGRTEAGRGRSRFARRGGRAGRQRTTCLNDRRLAGEDGRHHRGPRLLPTRKPYAGTWPRPGGRLRRAGRLPSLQPCEQVHLLADAVGLETVR